MGGESIGDGDDEGSEDIYKGSAESVLVSLSDLYSDKDRFLVGDNRSSSCPVYTVY